LPAFLKDFFTGDVPRIRHFVKVYNFAKFKGEEEEAALVYDIGIKPAEVNTGAVMGSFRSGRGLRWRFQDKKGIAPCRGYVSAFAVEIIGYLGPRGLEQGGYPAVSEKGIFRYTLTFHSEAV